MEEYRFALEDISWIIFHPYDVIVDFLLKNSLFAARFIHNPPGEVPGEGDLFYPRNWISIFHLVVNFLLTPLIAVLYPFLRMKSFGNMVRNPDPSKPSDVKWFFINGILVDHWWLDLNCRKLEMRFNVGVKGIYNRSYGPIWDIVESILQRDFNMYNASVINAIREIIRELRNEQPVRIIAHSQGAIIAGLVVDELYRLLSLSDEKNYLRNLEVFTFANGARDFRNPEGLIKVIEHYANIGDVIPRVGVLANSSNSDFDGDVFINGSTKGHLFNRYYSLNSQDYPIRTNPSSVLFHDKKVEL
ncbi:hypothetical protein Glove_274g10 [Diversispora epigaea]|uniref:Fungal lipase-like domain-containing protein n=1 Tax=Diversispora epigaea TaxID=1348612 RepID=A0A397I5L6_9GLOM|nr:hypothetical protein Glove_274g10 [Diversispora epigaea]